MTRRYKGATLSANAATATGGESGVAAGSWTLTQQAQAQSSGTWPIEPQPKYIEDVFSTYLYTGTGATQTINNGIDLAGKGGMTWIKQRNGTYNQNHSLTDTVRGAGYFLSSDTTTGQLNSPTQAVSAFTASGFSLTGNDNQVNGTYPSPISYASWTFRKQPKFFDVVTYTGNGAGQGVRAIAHGLTSIPGCIIIKRTDSTSEWSVWHRFAGVTNQDLSGISLNSSAASRGYPNGTTALMNASSFDPANIYGATGPASNESGATYVAYLFAHDAGGFGESGEENVVSCGSGTGSTEVTLGYEPQWVMIKKTATTSPWYMVDNMRGWTAPTGVDQLLAANVSNAEFSSTNYANPTATGFKVNAHTDAFIYIAIRRGPMKVPTDGNKVFDVGTRSGSGSVAKTNSNVLTDLAVIKNRTSGGEYWAWTPRLAGNLTLQSNSTDAELTGAMATNPWDTMTGAFCAAGNGATNSGSLIDYSFKRAPGFFDEVCYTGTGSATTVAHNLAKVPELMIVKSRSDAEFWAVYNTTTGNNASLSMNENPVDSPSGFWNTTTPTSSVFSLGVGNRINGSAKTYVAYLFATCAGVSKVGSYTGTATTKQIDCGFTGGARFVLIKRTDSAGNWYVWDSARGIVSGNDPYLLLDLTDAEVTTTDYIDPVSSGFEISSTAPAAINASGGSYIFLAIA